MIFLALQRNPITFSDHPPSPALPPQLPWIKATVNLLSWIYLFWAYHVYGITVSFCGWLFFFFKLA